MSGAVPAARWCDKMHGMSVLEFIASLKWPVVLVIAMVYAGRALKRNPGLTAWVKEWLNARNIRAKLGGQEIETTSAQQAVQTATATDEALLLQLADQPETLPPRTEPQQLRREAVEQIMRDAAEWGWTMARMGFRSLPLPQVEWNGDEPVIMFGAGSADQQVLQRHWNQNPRQPARDRATGPAPGSPTEAP